ncbi:unnamed protein product [Angiostrongylus costaricensis]|uniref:Uncharacterized protein n=1 Tax=Angiostrongylus costaricensis TaxID=334426 RepID=A0A0R3P9H1_ANGCS|nr:unnamed protein product [Angiostrongylus costaricensis]
MRLVTLSQPTLAVVGLSQLKIGIFFDDMHGRSVAIAIVRSGTKHWDTSFYKFELSENSHYLQILEHNQLNISKDFSSIVHINCVKEYDFGSFSPFPIVLHNFNNLTTCNLTSLLAPI